MIKVKQFINLVKSSNIYQPNIIQNPSFMNFSNNSTNLDSKLILALSTNSNLLKKSFKLKHKANNRKINKKTDKYKK